MHEFKACAENPQVDLKDINEWLRVINVPKVPNETAGRKLFTVMPLIKEADKLNKR